MDKMDKMDKKDIDRRVLIAGLGGAVAGSLLAGNAVAGSLNPSPGPPVGTMRDLTTVTNMIARTDLGCSMPPIPVESLPGTQGAMHTISISGSYYLVGNIQGIPGMDVIRVEASNVDICGGGFHIFVPDGSAVGLPTGRGMVCTGENVTFYDGSVIGGRIGLDFSQASRFIIWDCISIRALQAAMMLGSEGNLYDSEVHSCPQVGFAVPGSHTLIEEGAAFSCGTGYLCNGAQNLFIQNIATNGPTPFSIGPGNSYGPIVNVVGVGDISGVPGNNHPWANIVH
jgi:hypothetical protein